MPLFWLSVGLAALALVWLPYLPNASGRIGPDYAIWLPYLLAGDFWHVNAPILDMPWFNPALCGGVPLNADPQGGYLSLPQLLSFAVGPLRAIELSFFAFAVAGFAGTYVLARVRFRLGMEASTFAAILFLLNRFYAARMMVGHLSFAPFMLVPAMAACLLGPAVQRRGEFWRCVGFALLLAVMIEGGMAVLILPAYLCLAMMLVVQSLATGDALRAPVWRGIFGSVAGLALSAGKLVIVLALMAHVPRDNYPLPGFANLAETTLVAARALFFGAAPWMSGAIVHSMLRLELHEFEYGVGPAPLLLLLAWVRWGWQGHGAGRVRTRILWQLLLLLALLPLAFNSYAPDWSAFLKDLPILRSSSSLLRFFAAYMLPLILGGAVAMDRICARWGGGQWRLGIAAIGLTLLALLATDRGFYGAAGVGVYDPAPITRSWHALARTGLVPPVTRIVQLRRPDGTPDAILAAQNALIVGGSQMPCYDALFGYHLENLPGPKLVVGSVFDEGVVDGALRLNVKNPACDVFPAANACRPGDAFLATQRAAAARFLDYRPYGWARPWWAWLADWVGWVTMLAMLGSAVLLEWAHRTMSDLAGKRA